MARADHTTAAVLAEAYGVPDEIGPIGVLSMRALVRRLSPESRRALRSYLAELDEADQATPAP